MRTCFDIEERDEYHAARTLLTRRCLAWSGEIVGSVDAHLISSAFDSRHFSSDGRLTYWQPWHIQYFLLEWVPRYLDVDGRDLSGAPDVLRHLLRFIGDYGLRDPRGGTPADNEAAIDDAARRFPAALADLERFGVDRYWGRLARRHGVTVDGPESLRAFQQRAVREGLDLDPGTFAAVDPTRQLPWQPNEERAPAQLPVELPEPRRLVAEANRNVVIRRARTLIDWLGEGGRPVDSEGRLAEPDRQELAGTLGLSEIAEADRFIDWMKKARIVRRFRGRLHPIARAKPVLVDAIALWRRLFDAIEELGGRFLPSGAGGKSALARDLRDILPDILNSLYSLPSAMPTKRLEETVWWHCCGAELDIEELSLEQRRAHRDALRRDLTALWNRLSELGAIHRDWGKADPVFLSDLSGDGLDSPFDPDTTAELAAELRQPTELVSLTDLATFVMRDRMLAEGREAGLIGELAQTDAPEMLGVVTQHYPPDAAAFEVSNWLDTHDRDLEALLDVARSTPLRSRAAAILELLYDVDPSSAKLLRRVRSDPELAPAALVCLVETGILDMLDLTDSERRLLTAESSLRLMELDGPAPLIAGLEELPRSDARTVLDRVLTSGHPDRQAISEFRQLVVSPLRRERTAARPRQPVISPERLGATRRARLKNGGHA
ncbi:hypothetical protein FB566_0712 [Stackebrandtia endophytica]|uniref:Uncharacterized protein n=1 Tax=Stackebrandtia endophytica TaxID=1496996 RepID=A0A543ARS7_9ACTN|nr:hypothetical protein [Stackebrandtia endophytica]TQL75215.1 hypothetical protein FB566_0712 [Stackebrandtia endophytica]